MNHMPFNVVVVFEKKLQKKDAGIYRAVLEEG